MDPDVPICIFISDLLPNRSPLVERALRESLGRLLRSIPGTKDIWCRDFMPVPVPGRPPVQFRYDPDYLRTDPHLRTADGASLLEMTDCPHSKITLDGGNVVRLGRTVIVTDKIYSENPKWERKKLQAELCELLGLDHLILIPTEPGDVIGHADGVLAFVDEQTLLVNNYRRVAPAYGKRLASVLRRYGFDLVPFPYCPSDRIVNGIPVADGVYINFLNARGKLLFPTYGRKEDDEAARILEKSMPGDELTPVPCNDLAEEGGVIHCATWHCAESATKT